MILTPKNWNEFQHYKDRAPQWIKLHRALLDNYEYSTLPIASRALAPMLWLLASEFDGGRIKGSLDSIAFRFHMTRGDLADALGPLIDAGFFATDEEGAETAEQCATLSQRVAKSNGFGSRHISDATKRIVWERDGGKCCSCGSEEDIEYDHKHPVSKGGNSEEGNIQLLCRPCNRRKRTRAAAQAEQGDTDLLSLRSLEKEDIGKRDIDKEQAEKEARTRAYSFGPNEFVEFWDEWPNRVGKSAAVKALAAARKRGVPFETIMNGVRTYKRTKPPDRAWMNPATFLNGDRWEDQPAPAAILSIAKPLTEFQRKQQETSDVTAQLRAYANSSGSGGQTDRILPDDSGKQPADLRGGTNATVLALPRALGGGGN